MQESRKKQTEYGYGNDTIAILRTLEQGNTVLKSVGHQLVLWTEDRKFFLPNQSHMARDLIDLVRNEGETQRAMAKRCNCAQSALSNILAEQPKRPIARTLALRLLLNAKEIPDLNDMNHWLMQLRVPGLYLDTFDARVNQENWMLHDIVDYAQNQPCPGSSWFEVSCFHFRQKHLFLFSEPGPEFLHLPQSLERQMAQTCRLLPVIDGVDYSVYRRQLLDRYMNQNQIRGRHPYQEAYRRLNMRIAISPESIPKLFMGSNTKSSHGSRRTLIELAIEMNCSLDETNRLLREANYALLYPKFSDETELELSSSIVQKRNESTTGQNSQVRH